MYPYYPGGHTAYQDFVIERFRKYYPTPDNLPDITMEIAERFWNKDLTDVDVLMRNCYSKFGPKPRPASCMLRSYLLSIAVKCFSITEWVNQLQLVPAYAIISGFDPDDTPGVGTFYDFFSRLWLFRNNNLTPHEHPPKPRPDKSKKKGEKAASADKLTVDQMLSKLQADPPSRQQPFSLIFKVFEKLFLEESVRRGLIDPDALALSGDGTPVVTSAQQRKKRLCNCRESGITNCDCDRYYSQPDCDIGWDSHRGCYYHGYSLYLLTASDSFSDLPVFPLLNPASRHDSLGFLQCFFTMKTFLPRFQVSMLLLDSAHDAMAIYQFCRKENISPFIDLNRKRGAPCTCKNDFSIGPDGIPICRAGLKMRPDGVEYARYRSKYRCPLMNRSTGICSCQDPCSTSKFGRTVHLARKDNPRLFNIPPRNSPEWENAYKDRTSSERCNKRLKEDFHLEDAHHRSSKMWYCRLYASMMLQHLCAWDLSHYPRLTALL